MAVVNRSTSNEASGTLEAADVIVSGIGVIGNELFGSGELVAGACVVEGTGIIALIGSGQASFRNLDLMCE